MKTSDRIKYWIINRIYDSRFKSKLNPSDSSSIYRLRRNIESPLFAQQSKPLEDVKLKAVYLNEVFHINDYQKVRKGILRLARKRYSESGYFGDINYKELDENLQNFSTAFDNAQIGKFLRINFYKSRFHKNKPFFDATIFYHKTNESFIVMTIKISPKKLVQEKFESICSNEDRSYTAPNFYKWINIIKNRCFLKSESIHSSLKTENLDKELEELCYPAERFLRKHLKGYFNSTVKTLPKIINLGISDTESLKHDNVLSRWFNFEECDSTFEHNNQWITHWYPSSFNDSRRKKLFILDTKDSKNTIYEHGKIIQSLAFFWGLDNYFDLKRERAKILKREIYDFANGFSVKYWTLIKSIFQTKYRKIKYKIAQDQIIYSIFKSEFDSSQQFATYMMDSNMQLYTNHKFCKKEDKEKLHINRAQIILDKADANSQDINKLNERFKPIEELNNFNTSTSLDTIAIVISLVAFLFTYEKLIELIKNLISWVNEHYH